MIESEVTQFDMDKVEAERNKSRLNEQIDGVKDKIQEI